MWRKAIPYMVIGSLGINFAFAAVWVANAWPISVSREPSEQSAIWCPLHRELEVTPGQWAEIEPRLREFQKSVGELSQQVDRARSEVIEMVAAEQPDLEAIRTKQDEILTTKRAIQSRVVEHLLAEKGILSEDQQARLFEMFRHRTGCSAEPPMSGRDLGRGIGQALRQRED